MASSRGKTLETEAVIIESRFHEENDLRVRFFSGDYGLVSGVARHAQKSRKRFGTLLRPLNLVRVRFRNKKGLVFLEETQLAHPLYRLHQDLGALLAGFYFLDLVKRFIPERQGHQKIHTLLKRAILALEQQQPVRKVLSRFQYRFLVFLGLQPQLVHCLTCQQIRKESDLFYFVMDQGGLLCGDCHPEKQGLLFNEKTMVSVLAEFLEYHLGYGVPSWKILRKILSLN